MQPSAVSSQPSLLPAQLPSAPTQPAVLPAVPGTVPVVPGTMPVVPGKVEVVTGGPLPVITIAPKPRVEVVPAPVGPRPHRRPSSKVVIVKPKVGLSAIHGYGQRYAWFRVPIGGFLPLYSAAGFLL